MNSQCVHYNTPKKIEYIRVKKIKYFFIQSVHKTYNIVYVHECILYTSYTRIIYARITFFVHEPLLKMIA